MELEEYNNHTQEQIETAKTLIRQIEGLEFAGDSEEAGIFGNLRIDCGDFIDDDITHKLYRHGFAVNSVYDGAMYIRPIKGEEQTAPGPQTPEELKQIEGLKYVKQTGENTYEIELKSDAE